MEMLSDNIAVLPNNLKNRLCWSSVFAGVTVALLLGWLFNLLGAGIGLSNFAANNDPMPKIGMGSIIWLILSGIISIFIGSLIAARSAGVTAKSVGALQGILTWSVATLCSFLLAGMAAGSLIGATGTLMGKSVSFAAKSVGAVSKAAAEISPQIAEMAQDAFPNTLNQIKEQISQIEDKIEQNKSQTDTATDTTSSNAKEVIEQLSQAATTFLKAEDEEEIASSRQKLTGLLMKYTNVDQTQAEQQINEWQEKYQKAKDKALIAAEAAKQKAVELAKQGSKTLAQVSLITFFALLLSGIASAVGGVIGVVGYKRVNSR